MESFAFLCSLRGHDQVHVPSPPSLPLPRFSGAWHMTQWHLVCVYMCACVCLKIPRHGCPSFFRAPFPSLRSPSPFKNNLKFAFSPHFGARESQPSTLCRQGYGDKFCCIVTSLRSKLAGRFRAEGKIICCSISNGLEMDLKGKFMPPITKARKKTILRHCSLAGLHYPHLIPFLFSSINEISCRSKACRPAGRSL